MGTPVEVEPRPKVLSQNMIERPAWVAPGLVMLFAGLALVVVGIILLATFHNSPALTTVAVVLFVVSSFGFGGLTPVAPGEARVIQLFGKYKGTVRDPGLQ